jgi:hypothetical protein
VFQKSVHTRRGFATWPGFCSFHDIRGMDKITSFLSLSLNCFVVLSKGGSIAELVAPLPPVPEVGGSNLGTY